MENTFIGIYMGARCHDVYDADRRLGRCKGYIGQI